MIVLRSEPLTNDYSVREIAEFDTKAAILESFAILHLGVAKSYRKGELAWLLDHMFNENPALFANILPEKEQIPYDTKLSPVMTGHYQECSCKVIKSPDLAGSLC